MMRLLIAITCLEVGLLAVFAQDVPIPGAPQSETIILKGGTIVPVEGAVIENGDLIFDSGKIRQIGRNLPTPVGAVEVSIAGKYVFPALIESLEQIGILEIGAVRATNDSEEVGEFNPNVKGREAFDPDDPLIAITRSNGVGLAVVAPEGDLISGQADLMMLDGWTWEDMTLKASVGMTMTWPKICRWSFCPPEEKQQKDIDKKLKHLDQFMTDAKAYKSALDAAIRAGGDMPAHDPLLNAMLPVISGEMPLWIYAQEIGQIQEAVAFSVRHQVKMVLLGGDESPEAAAILKQHNVPVIALPILNTPLRRDSPYDAAFTLPARLAKAGVQFAIAGGPSFAGNARNLPYHAAMAVSFGLAKNEALKAITLYPAQLMGIDSRVGSLVAGKDATLIVTDGDPLEITTQVERMYIQGREVDLDNKQKALYRKYRAKYRQ